MGPRRFWHWNRSYCHLPIPGHVSWLSLHVTYLLQQLQSDLSFASPSNTQSDYFPMINYKQEVFLSLLCSSSLLFFSLPHAVLTPPSLQWQIFPSGEAKVCQATTVDNPNHVPIISWGEEPEEDEGTAVVDDSKAYNFACQDKQQCSSTFSYAWFDIGIFPCAKLPWLYP